MAGWLSAWRSSGRDDGVAALGAGALAVVCCAAFPLLVASAWSLVIGPFLRAGAVLAATVLVAVVIVPARRRRSSEATASLGESGPPRRGCATRRPS